MLLETLLPWLSSLRLDTIQVLDNTIVITLTTVQPEATCPSCQRPSGSIHSCYHRTVADLPWAGSVVLLHLNVRKFFCHTSTCARAIFTERLPELVLPYGRRSQRLFKEQRQIALDQGSEAGARTAFRQGMEVSSKSLLRYARRAPGREHETPCILGVDDWALRKGHSYGTILVDLERHCPHEIRKLRAAGCGIRQISRQLNIGCRVVQRYANAEVFPERATPRKKPSILDPFVPYMKQQLAAGRSNGMQLWREIRHEMGYKGSRSLVSRWVAQQRYLVPVDPEPEVKPSRGRRPKPAPKKPVRIVSASQAAWFLVRSPEDLDERDSSFLERLRNLAPDVNTAYTLAQDFIQMVRDGTAHKLNDWFQRVESTAIQALQSFAAGLRCDFEAVTAALSLPYSNGQVEGQINRLKLIKRTMYGRANFDLLKQRVLAR